MALKAKITKEEHAKLPALVQAEYVDKDGVYLLQVEAVDGIALEDITGLKSALGSERQRAKELENLSAKFKDLDPDKAREALAKMADLASGKGDEKLKAQLEAVTAQLAQKHAGELSALQGENKSLMDQITDVLRDQTARVAIRAAGATDTGSELLFPKVRERIRVEKNSAGKFVAVVVDDKGNPQITNRSGSHEAMGIGELVETFKKPFAMCFQGSGATGSGAPGKGSEGKNGGSTANPSDLTVSPAERLRSVRRELAGQ